MAGGDVVPGRVGVESGEGGAVVAGRRRIGVENFRQAVRALIAEARQRRGQHRGDGGEAEDGDRQDQQGQHGQLDLARLDLLAQKLRRAADHQTGDEHRQHGEHQQPVETRADAARQDLAKLDQEQRNHAAERRQRIVHGVDRAAGQAGGHRRIKGGHGHAEADFLAFHIAGATDRGQARSAADCRRFRPNRRRRRR